MSDLSFEIAQEQAFRIAELEIERDSAWVGLRQLKTANDSLKAENKAFRSDPTKGWCEYEHEIAGLEARIAELEKIKDIAKYAVSERGNGLHEGEAMAVLAAALLEKGDE